MPDERKKCPSSGLNRGSYHPSCVSSRPVRAVPATLHALKDIKPGLQVFLMPLSDRYLIAENIDRIPADVVDLAEIDDIGTMDLEKGLSV